MHCLSSLGYSFLFGWIICFIKECWKSVLRKNPIDLKYEEATSDNDYFILPYFSILLYCNVGFYRGDRRWIMEWKDLCRKWDCHTRCDCHVYFFCNLGVCEKVIYGSPKRDYFDIRLDLDRLRLVTAPLRYQMVKLPLCLASPFLVPSTHKTMWDSPI